MLYFQLFIVTIKLISFIVVVAIDIVFPAFVVTVALKVPSATPGGYC